MQNRFIPDAIIFGVKADVNLYELKIKLINQTYHIGNYRQFKIYDPKERLITAATFEDRIVHHAIMNVLEPVFERQFVFHTYACRKNKGTHKAIKYVYGKSKHCKYFLKLDIRKYFDSISHIKLKELLKRIIKDEKTLQLLFQIVDSYSVIPTGISSESEIFKNKKGLPIGNLTSQFFANYYLSGLDHFVLEQLKPKGYVRYMDDIIVFSDSKADLKKMFLTMSDFISSYELSFKQPIINSCKNGIPFLGYSISDKKIKLLNKNRKRKVGKIKQLTHQFERGVLGLNEYSERLSAIQNGFFFSY